MLAGEAGGGGVVGADGADAVVAVVDVAWLADYCCAALPIRTELIPWTTLQARSSQTRNTISIITHCASSSIIGQIISFFTSCTIVIISHLTECTVCY